jgi:hypothetical protein
MINILNKQSLKGTDAKHDSTSEHANTLTSLFDGIDEEIEALRAQGKPSESTKIKRR